MSELLNFALSLLIVVAALYIARHHVVHNQLSPDVWMLTTAVLVLASVSLITSVVPAFDLDEQAELFRFLAGVLRGATLVLLCSYALRYSQTVG